MKVRGGSDLAPPYARPPMPPMPLKGHAAWSCMRNAQGGSQDKLALRLICQFFLAAKIANMVGQFLGL
jgi:hypothetical protein